jgi:hypothetical protein
MPISYSIHTDKCCIIETWTGDITAHDLANHWMVYLADPDVMALRRTLVDLRNARILFTGAQLASLVETIAMPAIGDRDWKSAILVSDPVQFGVSRQYQVFAETYSRDSIFGSESEALNWLRE